MSEGFCESILRLVGGAVLFANRTSRKRWSLKVVCLLASDQYYLAVTVETFFYGRMDPSISE